MSLVGEGINMNQNIERLHRLFDGVWNGEDPAVVADLVSEEYVIHDRELAQQLRGPELYRTLASMTRNGFSDMTITIEDSVAAGDRVALRWTMTGTHDGSVFGLEPTGKRIEYSAIEIDRFEDGLLAESWVQADMLGLMEQLGALPPTENDEP